jgi:hypothetical protein
MLHGALLEVDMSYRLFFEQLKRGEKASTPRFRSVGRGPWSVRWQTIHDRGPLPAAQGFQRLNTPSCRWATFSVPKLGPVKVRLHRPLPDDALIG